MKSIQGFNSSERSWQIIKTQLILIGPVANEMDKSSQELHFEKWSDPYDSDWLKIVTILVYIVNLMASIIMVAFIVYETKGLAGHYRTLVNQLMSCTYGAVRF